jgi:flagellar basal body-associated protein FliL
LIELTTNENNKLFLKKQLMTKKAIIITGIGIVVGAIAGYFYYFFVGCTSGTCAITSKPLNSTLYGALMGGLVFNLFVKSPKKS